MNEMNSKAVVIGMARTPFGRLGGALAPLTATTLGAVALTGAIDRSKIDPSEIEHVTFGEVLQAGVGQNPARQAALKAGLPDTIAAFTVNKVCGSGLKAVMLAAQAIRAGDAEVIVAGGMESMSQAPYLLFGARAGWKYGDQKVVDAMIHDGLWCAFEDWHMGEAAEHIAAKCGVSRAEQDRFAAQSQQRAAVPPAALSRSTAVPARGRSPPADPGNRCPPAQPHRPRAVLPRSP